jgi:hypothetical protein
MKHSGAAVMALAALGLAGIVAGCSAGRAGSIREPDAGRKAQAVREQGAPVKASASAKEEGMKSIGSATMKQDGTIVLELRAIGPGGERGDGLLTYPPDHPAYKEVLDHLGGLKPGESKPVPPWPDDPAE